jgi:hypothetical protein
MAANLQHLQAPLIKALFASSQSNQRITVAQFVADEYTPSRSDGVADTGRGANTRAASEQNARSNREKKGRVLHCATVISG